MTTVPFSGVTIPAMFTNMLDAAHGVKNDVFSADVQQCRNSGACAFGSATTARKGDTAPTAAPTPLRRNVVGYSNSVSEVSRSNRHWPFGTSVAYPNLGGPARVGHRTYRISRPKGRSLYGGLVSRVTRRIFQPVHRTPGYAPSVLSRPGGPARPCGHGGGYKHLLVTQRPRLHMIEGYRDQPSPWQSQTITTQARHMSVHTHYNAKSLSPPGHRKMIFLLHATIVGPKSVVASDCPYACLLGSSSGLGCIVATPATLQPPHTHRSRASSTDA